LSFRVVVWAAAVGAADRVVVDFRVVVAALAVEGLLVTGKKFGPSVQQSFDETNSGATAKNYADGFIGRWWRHSFFADLRCEKVFNAEVFHAIEEAITASEKTHTCEIRFVVESDLSNRELCKGISPRQRALELFAELGVWDTELNNGILIYVMFADRAVEVIADRAVVAAIPKDSLAHVARTLTEGYKAGEFLSASVASFAVLTKVLEKAFAADPTLAKFSFNPNELPNSPTRL
jgi:uncharacterized membrane protein